MRLTLIICLLSVVMYSVAGCSSNEAIENKGESITQYKVSESTLSFSALSKGCTHNDDFVLVTDEISDFEAKVYIERVTPDMCKRVPYIKKLELSLDDKLKGKQVNVINPIVEEGNFKN